MLTNELLLASPKKDKEYTYTHTITVGVQFDRLRGFFNDGRYPFGDINPRTFLGINITGLFSGDLFDTTKDVTELVLDTSPQKTRVYVGRTDTKKVLSLDVEQGLSNRFGVNVNFFHSDDIGKTVQLWLATTPPPWA